MKHFLLGKTRSAHIQFFRYLFVGGSSALVDISVFTVCVELFDLHYLIANVLAFIFGFSWNYLWSIAWIFESKHRRYMEFFMVFLIAVTGLILTSALLFVFVEWIHLSEFVSKIAATWIVLFWNFGMRKLYVFH